MHDAIDIPRHLLEGGQRHLMKVLAHGVRRTFVHRPRRVTMRIDFKLLHSAVR